MGGPGPAIDGPAFVCEANPDRVGGWQGYHRRSNDGEGLPDQDRLHRGDNFPAPIKMGQQQGSEVSPRR
jgi:hypothetical protein